MKLSQWNIWTMLVTFLLSVDIVRTNEPLSSGTDSLHMKASRVMDWSRELLKLLDVDFPSEQSWHKELLPIVNFVRNIKDDDLFEPWLLFVNRLVITTSGPHAQSDFTSYSRTPLSKLLAMIEQLVVNDRIEAAVVLLSNQVDPVQLLNQTLGLKILSEQSSTISGHEMTMERFMKQLYNIMRRHFRSTTTTTTTSTPPMPLPALVNLATSSALHPDVAHVQLPTSSTSLLSSPSTVEALRMILVDLFQMFQKGNFGLAASTNNVPSLTTTSPIATHGPELVTAATKTASIMDLILGNSSLMDLIKPSHNSSHLTESNTIAKESQTKTWAQPMQANMSYDVNPQNASTEDSMLETKTVSILHRVLPMDTTSTEKPFQSNSVVLVADKATIEPPPADLNTINIMEATTARSSSGNPTTGAPTTHTELIASSSPSTTVLIMTSTTEAPVTAIGTSTMTRATASTESSTTTNTPATLSTTPDIFSNTTTSNKTSSVTSISTTENSMTTTLSIEDRVAALFPKRPPTIINVNSTTSNSKPAKKWTPKKRTTTPRTTTTTTPYQKYPTTKTPVELSTVKEETKSLLSIWADSDVKQCRPGKICIFRGRIVVTGFVAHLQKEWKEISDNIVSTMSSALRQLIADSQVGSGQNRVSFRRILPTSTQSAEITFDVKIVEPEFSVSGRKLTELINSVGERYFDPYSIMTAFTEFQLSNPEAIASNTLSSPLKAASAADLSITPSSIGLLMAGILVGLPLMAWMGLKGYRHLKARNVHQKLKMIGPVYCELSNAVSSLRSNNLYTATPKKNKSLPRLSIFDLEREKEQEYYKMLVIERQKVLDEANGQNEAGDRPLPAVPDISAIESSPGSPMMTSSFQHPRKRRVAYLSGRFLGKKMVRFDELLTEPQESPRLSFRESSMRRMTQLTQSFRQRHQRIRDRSQHRSRPSLDGVFNLAFVADDGSLSATDQHSQKVSEQPETDHASAVARGFTPPPEVDSIEVIQEESFAMDNSGSDLQHEYEVIGYKSYKSNYIEDDTRVMIVEDIDAKNASEKVVKADFHRRDFDDNSDGLIEQIYGTV